MESRQVRGSLGFCGPLVGRQHDRQLSAGKRGSRYGPNVERLRQSTARRSALIWVPGVIASGAIPALSALQHGAFGIARNDDWAYSRALFRSYASGHFVVDSYTKTMLVGQLAATWPVRAVFGESLVPLQVWTLVLGMLGLTAFGLLARQFLSPIRTLVTLVIVGLGPLFGSLAVSFMTDIPAMALEYVALWCAFHALRGPKLRSGWWAGALGFAAFAFSIREFAAAVVLVLALALWFSRRRGLIGGRTQWAWAGLFVWLGGAVALYEWRLRGPVAQHDVSALQVGMYVVNLPAVALTLGVQIAPLLGLGLAVLAFVWRRRRPVAGALGLVAIGMVALLLHRTGTFFGNYIGRTPSYGETLPWVAVLRPKPWRLIRWAAAVTPASLAVFVLLILGLRRSRPQERSSRVTSPDGLARMLSGSFAILMTLTVVAVSLVSGIPIFDRYLLPAVAPLCAWLLGWPELRRGMGAFASAAIGIGVGLWVVYGVYQVDLTSAADGVRWRVASQTVARGYRADEVDAGYEWFSAHQQGEIRMPPVTVPDTTPTIGPWVGLFTPSKVCVGALWGGGAGRRPSTAIATSSETTWFGHHLTVNTYPISGGCVVP